MLHRIINLILRLFFLKSCEFHSTVVFYVTSKIINSRAARKIKIGAYSHIRGELLVFPHGGKIRLGKYCYVGENTKIWSSSEVFIGDRTLVSHNVNIFDNIVHPFSAKERHEQFKSIISTGQPEKIDLSCKAVKIGNDVLVGANSTILMGVTLGDGSIVGAGSVVTKDVPSFTIVAGNPARKIRTLTQLVE